MASFFHKFKIVLWKNLLIRKFHWILTLLELAIPLLLFVGLVALNSLVTRHASNNPEEIYPSTEEVDIYRYLDDTETFIYYAPSNSMTKKIMDRVGGKFSPKLTITGVENETELENSFKHFKISNSSAHFFGVIFGGNTTKNPLKRLEYTIRSEFEYHTTALFSALASAASADMYKSHGFVALQIAIDKSFIDLDESEDIKINIQQFPTPAMKESDARHGIFELLRAATVLSFIFLCPAVLKRVVEEKSSGVKELMKLMGVPSLVVWLGWLVHALIIALFAVTVIVILLITPFKQGEPVLMCSPIVVWIFLMLYCTASIFFLFAISVLFRRPMVAMIFGILAWLGSYVGSIFIVDNSSSVKFCCKVLSSLLPNVALGWGYKAMYYYENKDIGMTFSNVVNPSIASPGDLYLWQVWLMLAIESGLYFALALYIEAVFPGEYGIGKPWYFPLTECMNFIMRIKPRRDMKNGDGFEKETFEPLAGSLPMGIQIRGLRKVFQSTWSRESKAAVDGVSLDICKEQITALLGHNGAGKTTTMMILSGMLAPTEGTVYIDGYDINRHMSRVRESLGLCPQHNLLFSDLTVEQHLVFFAWLKCSTKKDAQSEVDLFMTKLNLHPHKNFRPNELSGGYKRRLSLGIAFIGHAKTVILDEPTSGLDPEARREIWDLLLSMRGERTILITTHIMEEADVLGDRIAIMDHGRVQCYGTPMFLKKLYGTGYVLSVLKKPSSHEEPIKNAVLGVIPDAECKSSVASLMTFRLPDDKRSSFPQLFAVLQREREPLGIECVGVSITTLEEVFLRVGEIALEESGKGDDCISETSERSECSLQALSPGNIKGVGLLRQQLAALIKKQFLVLGSGHIIQAVIMFLVILLVTRLSIQTFGGSADPPLQLSLSKYGRTHVMYKSNATAIEQIVSMYTKNVKDIGSVPDPVPHGQNITSALLAKASEAPEQFVDYVVAAEFKKHHTTALYYDVALHSLPVSVNLITNALLRYQKQDDEYSISVSNYPFKDEVEEYMDDMSVVVLWVTLVPLALTFWMGQFIRLPLQERVSASRQQQRMAGVSVPLYWLTLYIWDLLLHILLVSALLLVIYTVDTIGLYRGAPEMSMLFVILLLYGISAIPFSYFVSFWKDTQASAFACLVIVNIVGGLFMMLLMEILQGLGVRGAEAVQSISRLLPNFALTDLLQNYMVQFMTQKHCLRMTPSQLKKKCASYLMDCCRCKGEDCYDTKINYFKENKSLLLFLGLSYLLYCALVVVLDMGLVQWLWERLVALLGLSNTSDPEADDDVQKEAQYVQDVVDARSPSNAGSDMLVNNLKKKYGLLRKPLAVKGVSFQVKPGECFGLLGVNGAGKTSTFKMLTGAVVPTAGTAVVSGYRLDRDKSQFLAQIGYCPQQDALIECLSAWQLLQLYGSLRGIPADKLDSEVDRWINMMGLREYKDKSCGTYSGGNKRKLSTALALIGGPPLVFLDEPTSGVDPVARRNLWNVLISLQKGGQSIVLTSHSMEECEALCNRLGIMVAGQLVCVGSIPYLKNKFKQGSTVKIKLCAGRGTMAKEEIKSEVENAFRSSVLKDEHETLLHYQVTDTSLSWGTLFEMMENLKKTHDAVEDYTISETSLEEVFLAFAQNN